MQIVVGSAPTAEASPSQPVVLLEANVDDATGEVLAHAVGRLLDSGAHDAWITPIVMKKGRPAHTVAALVDPVDAGRIAGVLTAETGSLGVRGSRLDKWPAARTVETVDVDGQAIRVKVTSDRIKVEFDDAAAAASSLGLPVREVLARAEAAARAARPR